MSHFYDPLGEFRRMRAALRPGGWLIFETGNGGDVDPKYFEHFSVFQYPDHLFFFSLANVLALLERSDFELVELHRYSVLPQLRALETLDQGEEAGGAPIARAGRSGRRRAGAGQRPGACECWETSPTMRTTCCATRSGRPRRRPAVRRRSSWSRGRASAKTEPLSQP